MAQTNPPSGVKILENIMKGKEGKYTWKSTSDNTNREKVDREARNIEDLLKRKRRGDTSSTMTIRVMKSQLYERKPLSR